LSARAGILFFDTGWTTRVLGFDFPREFGIFLFTTESRTALGSTQPLIQWVTGPLSPGVKRPGREADHSPPSSAEVKSAWMYTSTPPYVFMPWYFVKHRDFTDKMDFYGLPRVKEAGRRMSEAKRQA